MSEVIKNGTVYIAPNATVVGDVVLEDGVNIWYGAVLRGDAGRIHIGANTNIQDNCIFHDETTIGEGCTIGHGAIVHGCTVGDHSMIGMGAIVLSRAVIGSNCVIGAGAVIKEDMVIPDGHMAVGIPAKIIGETKEALLEEIAKNERSYLMLSEKTFGK